MIVDGFVDTDVIDTRAPRFNQAFVAVCALVGVVFSWPVIWALLSLQLVIGLVFGRRWCLPCWFYFTFVAPRLSEAQTEDSRPPRLANMIGAVVLGSAAAAYWLGAPVIGLALASLVVILATIASTVNFCLGCWIYRLVARVRIGARDKDSISTTDLPTDWNGGRVLFTHPLCSECHAQQEKLGPKDHIIDVRQQPQTAREYGIRLVPTVFEVNAAGLITGEVL